MFEEKREGKNGELGEKERADLCYKKLSFEVLETFVCFRCFRCCAVIKAKDRFFSTHHPSSSSSLPLCSSLVCYSSPPKCICVHAERLCIFCVRFDVLMTTWRANYSQRFPPLFSFCHFFRFQHITSGFSRCHCTDSEQDRIRQQLTLSWIKSSRRGKTYQNVYRSLNYVSQSWIWWSLVDLSVFSCHVFIGVQSKQFFKAASISYLFKLQDKCFISPISKRSAKQEWNKQRKNMIRENYRRHKYILSNYM